VVDILHNYRDFLARVDELCHRIGEEFGAHLACGPGCSGCCRHLSLSWVEGMAISRALAMLPPDEAGVIRDRARASSPDACPLLEGDLCLLYDARPVICRTHGLPVLTVDESGERRVDFCPRNFRDVSTLPGSAVIDLDRLNTALAAINALFIADYFHGVPPSTDRLSLAEALLLDR